MNWPAYPEYMASGIEWLGTSPSHWTHSPIKYACTILTGFPFKSEGFTDDADDVPLLRGTNVGVGQIDWTDVVYWPRSEASAWSEYELRPGDIVIGLDRPFISAGIRVSRLGLDDVPSLLLQRVARIRAVSAFEQTYLFYLLTGPGIVHHLTPIFTGVSVPHVSPDQVASFPIPQPPLDEQRQIVAYLDVRCNQIDALIGKQEQLIATLREDRNAQLINLVAHGCDSATSLKPSGLGWVDAVPVHWDVVNIRRVALMKTGHTPSRSVAEYWEDTTIPWFTLADVWQLRDGLRTYLGETTDRISELGLANSAADLLPADTVVLSRTASVGFTGIMPTSMATSQDFWNWVCGPQLLPEYLMYTFRAMQGYFSALMMGSTHKTIYQADAAAIRIPLPPLSEQQEIVREIGSKTAAIDALITKAVQVIETVREYRAALITDAVTGKIDVRGAA